MLPVNSLSFAAYALRNLFLHNIDDLDDINNVRIGHPADTIKDLESLDHNCLCMFFYDVNYDGFPADVTSENPFYVRLHCLITPVGNKTTEPESPGSATDRDVSKGENELRMIGEVMRILHQQPFVHVNDGDGNPVAQLQVVPQPLNLDNLNHIWSTQSDVSYRLSVAYEMALAPVPNALPVDAAPITNDPLLVPWGAMHRKKEQELQGAKSYKPEVEYHEVDTTVADWVPHIAFVDELEDSTQVLRYVAKLSGDLANDVNVLIAGKENSTLRFHWNIWRRKDDNSIEPWKENIADVVAPVDKTLSNPMTSDEPYNSHVIDPKKIDSRRIFKARLPAEINQADTKNWQAQLYAIYDLDVESPPGSGVTKSIEIKSNALMLYGDGS